MGEHRGALLSPAPILWLAANAGNYFKIRGNQSNDYTLITVSLMIIIIMTLLTPGYCQPPLRAAFCLFERLDLDWCEMRRAGTGATGQSLAVLALTTAPLTPHMKHVMIYSPPDACIRAGGVLFSLGLTNGSPKVWCAHDGILQQNRWETAAAAWRMGEADLPASHYSGLVSIFCSPKQSNRVWFLIAIVIFKSGSDLGRASWKS